MAAGSVRFIISTVVAIITALALLPFAYFTSISRPVPYVLVGAIVVAVATFIISFICNIVYQKITCNEISLKKAAIGAGIAPIGSVVGLLFGGIMPVLFGAVPPRFRTKASDANAGMFSFLRNIPESVLSNTSEDAKLPAAEMFWSFWGAIYGQTYAFGVVGVC